MAPIVRGETMELLDDYLEVLGVNFDEISSLATSEGFFDHTKLMEDNVIDVSLQPTVVLQPASPQSQPQLVNQDQEFFIHPDTQPDSPEFVVLQPAIPEPFLQQTLNSALVPQQAHSPEPSNIQGQPANPLFQPQPVDQEYFIHSDTHPASPEFLVLPPAMLDPFLQQALSPEPSSIKVQPASTQEFDLLQLSSSLESLASSPADSMLSPISVLQEEEAASPAPQQVGDAPKKRGRKRKYPEGMAPSRRRPKKPKVYEMQPLPDSEMEKKRKNAVNAKRHRDMQKEEKQKLSVELAQATAERNRLLQVVNQYKEREQQLLQVMNVHGIKIDDLDHTLDGL